MRRSIVFGLAAVAALATGSLLTQAAEPVKTQPTELMTAPLTGDPSREVKIINVVLPPGADTGRHYHHGDQYTTVQEGEIHITIEGKGEQVFKAGDVAHVDPMVVHRTQNTGDKPARTTELFLVAKGKPLSEREEAAATGSTVPPK
jgi:quercetin dioxygenase-like cupin family protein